MIKFIIKNISEFTDEEYKLSYSFMNNERQNKVKRYKNILSKKCTLAGELLVRRLLSEVTGMTQEKFIITADSKGKLFCENTEGLFFNISHSGNLVTAVISDKKAGIDIEIIKSVPMKMAERISTKEELIYIFNKIPDESDYLKEATRDTLERFFEVWTAKEAYFKCIGTGITNFKNANTLSGLFKKKLIKSDDYIIHIVTL